MTRNVATTLALSLVLIAAPGRGEAQVPESEIVLVVHGGAGTLSREGMSPETRGLYVGDLEAALRAGHAILKEGGSSLDAVVASIKILEDAPRFNAGKGAVFTHEGHNELDASLMEGDGRRAGAVAGVTVVKHPIEAARAVMERSPHVMMAGPGADAFARSVGLEIVDPAYFRTDQRWDELQRALEAEKRREADGGRSDLGADRRYLGTVGAVALDRRGHLAAGTSTGGMTNKRFGRVGDSPVIGAGTFADDASCAVSCTGHGEFFIRYAVASDVAARVKYKGVGLQEAADEVIQATLRPIEGEGGLIALDRQGRVAISFNTEGMYRGVIRGDGVSRVAIFGGEELERSSR